MTTEQPNSPTASPPEFIIQPSGRWVRINLRELFHYRDLLFLLVRRDFIARYKQTILGPLWFVLQPLLTTVVFTVVFGQMAGLAPDGPPQLLFYLSGFLAWHYFSQCMNGTAQTFVANAHLFGKVYFPRLVMPLSVVVSNLLAYALQLGTFLCFWLYFKVFATTHGVMHPQWAIAWLPLIILQTAGLGFGIGLWMSALTAKYRDFAHLSGFLTQLWMFGTLPLFMSVAQIPTRFQWVLAANPLCPIVSWYRYAFLGLDGPNPAHMAFSVGLTAVLLVTGVLVFSRTERNFIDTV